MAIMRLELERGVWYGWQMLPGYFDSPYFSPIRVDEVVPLKTGRSVLRLRFLNACYAVGVKNFDVKLKVLKRTETYIAAEIVGQKERIAVIYEFSFAWFRNCCPDVWKQWPPSNYPDATDPQSYIRAAWADSSRYDY